MPGLSTYEKQAFDLNQVIPQPENGGFKTISSWVAADIDEIMGIERAIVPWGSTMRQMANSGIPMAGLGFAGLVLPNAEPVNSPSATTGVTAETNLYTPATTTNAVWAIMPQGTMKSPQTWLIFYGGVITSSSSAQTCAFTFRIGTSGTPSSNQSLGATGLVALGSTITNAPWGGWCMFTIRSPGTSGTAIGTATVNVGQQAAGSVTSTNTGMIANTTATFDTTLQQGFVISVTPSATGVSATLTNFLMMATD